MTRFGEKHPKNACLKSRFVFTIMNLKLFFFNINFWYSELIAILKLIFILLIYLLLNFLSEKQRVTLGIIHLVRTQNLCTYVCVSGGQKC